MRAKAPTCRSRNTSPRSARAFRSAAWARRRSSPRWRASCAPITQASPPAPRSTWTAAPARGLTSRMASRRAGDRCRLVAVTGRCGPMAKIIPVATFDCVVFGATGDLTLRKLLPALYYRFRDGQMPPESHVIAAARSDLDDDAYRKRASKALQEHVAREDLDADTADRFCRRAQLCPAGRDGCRRRTGRRWRTCSMRSACGCSISPPRPISTVRSAATSARTGWSPSSRASCWRSRSATTSPRRARSTTRSARCSARRRSSASTITSARRRCRTCWRCASPTRSSSGCGMPT